MPENCSNNETESADMVTEAMQRIPDFIRKRKHSLAALFGLSRYSFSVLIWMKCPPILFNTLWWFNRHMAECCLEERFRFADFFCGAAAQHEAFSAGCWPATKYDIKIDSAGQDILSAQGWVNYICMILSLIPCNSASTSGILCSSWVWICRDKTCRSERNVLGLLPDGSTYPSVGAGNKMVARATMGFMLQSALMIIWFLEQPLNSLMLRSPRMKHLQSFSFCHWISTWLGAFGSPTAKPTQILSNSRCVWKLKRKLRRKHFKARARTCDPHAKSGGVTGRPQELKTSQEYPPDFAHATFMAVRQAEFSELKLPVPTDLELSVQTEDLWDDADVISLAAWMRVPYNAPIVG